MAYYYGYFRSLDTSEDPRGQEYKVVIFTGWDGVSNPYPYYVPEGHSTKIPDTDSHIELTLSSHPFKVEFPKYDNLVEGGCRCSTAQINICMSQFVQDFLSSNNSRTLVALLRKNNNVTFSGSSYYNPNKTYRLYKTGFSDNGQTLWNDFLPENLDAYCYTTEWIGIATPESYNMSYNRVFNVFTLNAQDIISTFRYKKFSFAGEKPKMEGMYHWLHNQLYACGCIKHIYLTDTVHIPSTTGSTYHSNIMFNSFFQEQNFMDEVRFGTDEDENDELLRDACTDTKETLDNIMKYLGLQLIQWGDSVIITTPYAVTRGYSNYKHYSQFDNMASCKLVPQNINAHRKFSLDNDRNLLIQAHLNESSFTSDNVNISTDNVYSRAKLICSEYIPTNVITDINEDKNLDSKWPDWGITLKNRWNRRTAGGWQHTTEDYWCVRETLRWYPQNDDIRCYRYKELVHDSDYWSNTPIDPSTTEDHYQLYINNYNSSMVIDDGGIKHVGTNSATPDNFNPTRAVFFITPWSNDVSPAARSYYGWDNKNNFSLPMFYIRSKESLFHAGDYLNLGGTWAFWSGAWVGNSDTPDDAYGWAVPGDTTGKAGTIATYPYIWAKVKFGDKWLSSNSELNYTWSNTEQWTKLWLYCQPSSERSYGREFEFHSRERNISGSCIPLPIEAGQSWFTRVEITIDKPMGVGEVASTCARWSNPSVNVISKSFVDNDGTVDDDDSDSKYRTNIISDAMDERQDMKCTLSSATNKKLSYACVVTHPNVGDTGMIQSNAKTFNNMSEVYNAATGLYCIPEKHLVNQVSEQYRTPTLSLTCDVRRNLVTPYTMVDWSFAPERLMYPVSMSFDYEYETANMTVTEVKTIAERQTIRQNTTRNFRRNNDNLVQDIPSAHSFELPDPEYSSSGSSRERTVTVNNNGHVKMDTGNPIEGLIQVSPSISDDFHLLISIPNVIDDACAAKNSSNHAILYMDGSTPGGQDPVHPIDPPIDPVTPIDPIDPFPVEPIIIPTEPLDPNL